MSTAFLMEFSASGQDETAASSSCFGGFNCLKSSSSSSGMPSGPMMGRPKKASTEDYEAVLNEGMKHLTFDEIQHEQEVLHGVAVCDENDLPESKINELLSSVQQHLNQKKVGTAYEAAEQRDHNYTCNRELHMAYLRSNRFDPKESARKIINFFNYKRDLFGDESLVRDITSKDLSKDALKCLLEGYFQYSPFRDRSGRKIYWTFPGVRTKTSSEAELQARFYLWANTLDTMVDISKGMVCIDYLVGRYRDHLSGSGYIDAYNLFRNAMPGDVVGSHVCTNNQLERMITKTVCAMMPYHVRVRCRMHFGSHTECQYLLAGYGVTKAALPFVGPNSEMDLSHHHAWFQEKVFLESRKLSISPVSLPSPLNNANYIQMGRNENDVLCVGRVVKGVGNERLQHLAKIYFQAYEDGSTAKRQMLVNQIIDEIHSHGGRFLKLDPSSSGKADESSEEVWMELSHDERCVKIAQLFRNYRRRRPKMSPSTGPAIASSASGAPSSLTIGASTSASAPIIVGSAKEEDVLFGNHIKNNPGNRKLRELVLGVAEEYGRTERGKKKEIVLGLIAEIHKNGGRFLMAREDQRWEVMSDKMAKDKISKQFRNFRRKR